MTALIIAVYLIGCVVAYLLTKKYISDNGRLGWTIGYRNHAMLTCLFSWAAVLGYVMCVMGDRDDRPAKW